MGAVGGWRFLFFTRFQAFCHQAFTEATGFFEGFALGFYLAFEHIQGASYHYKHGVSYDDSVVGVEPAGVFFSLFQGVFGRFVDNIPSS